MNKLKLLRIDKGYSQSFLAFLAELAQPRISEIEMNFRIPTEEERKRLAEALQISEKELRDL